MTPAGPTRDDGLFELLDAYADGELAEDERRAVVDLLDRSAEARAGLHAIEQVRSMVRDLPAVDAPFGFYERLTRSPESMPRARRRRRRAPGVVFAAVGAIAAAVVLVVAIAPVGDRLAPPVEELSERHTMLASSTTEMPDGYTSMQSEDVADMSEPYELPAVAPSGYEQMAAYEAPEGVHVIYSNGTSMMSVFEQKGHIDWTDLPDGGARLSMDGDQAWVMTMSVADDATADVIVLALDGLLVTVIGGAPHDDVVAMAEAVPDPPSPSMTDRVGDACAWVAQGFGFPE